MAENNVESTNEDTKNNKKPFTRNNNRWGRRNRQGWKENHNSNTDQDQAPQGEDEGGHRQGKNCNKPERCEGYISHLEYRGPTLELPPYDLTEKKFAGRNRIYIMNVGNEITAEDLELIFKRYGEVSEVFINAKKNFAFLKLDYHANAVKARQELDGFTLKSRILRMRISPNCSMIKVKNLVPYVTTELLFYAFSAFGEIEYATVCVDERGRSTGEGIIDFTRKFSALQAIQKCKEKCFFLTNTLKPVVVEPYELPDQTVGLLDKHFTRRNNDFIQDRSVAPRLAQVGSFEHEYGSRWKALYELHKQKEETLLLEFRLECEKLEAQMEYARYEHETEKLRERLRARELDKERQKREWESRERIAEEERLRAEEHIRQAQEQIQGRYMRQQEEALRRQDEENLLLQAQNLNSLLETQEKNIDYDAPSSSTREFMGGAFDSTYNNTLLGVENSDQSWNRPPLTEGRWVRENVGFVPKKRRF